MIERKKVLALMGLVLAAPGLEASVSVVKMSDIRVRGVPEEDGTVHLGEILNNMEFQLHDLKLDHKQILRAVSEELPKLRAELQAQKAENERRFQELNRKIDDLMAHLDEDPSLL